MTDRPPIQLIANLVVHDGAGRVLLVDYDLPDEAVAAALGDITGITVVSTQAAGVQSFRGRRGWHISFDYRIHATGEAQADSPVGARWFAADALPRTAHGAWERGVVERVLQGA